MTFALGIVVVAVAATLVILTDSVLTSESPFMATYYCVIGAGPAGLQMGYFLAKAQRDYVIYEQSNISGSFFQTYPRHRKLISINKRHTGRTNKEFNSRHDWNSLLSDNEHLLMTKYSDDYFPKADVLVDYLNDFRDQNELNVKFNTKISQLTHDPDAKNEYCRYRMIDGNQRLHCCRNVFVATGWQKMNIPERIEGLENVETYETISTDPSDYRGQSVLIVGRGNSGMETAQSIYGNANFVHMLGRDRVRLSWETHYVGDIRGLNNEILDSYMLKSLDGVFEFGVNAAEFVKRSDGKIQLNVLGASEVNFVDQNPVRDGYDRVILCMGFKWDPSIFNSTMEIKSSTMPGVPKGKYPEIGYDYQSKQYPGLSFIGTLAHSLDYRKSAGGFIHGFRYSIRAQHRLLEWMNHGIRWPSKEKPIEQLLPTFLKRANEAAGIYQMFSHLGDVVIYDKEKKQFTYLEELPVGVLPALLRYTGYEFSPTRHALFVMLFEYGRNFSTPGTDHFHVFRAQSKLEEAHLSNFLHPVVYYYDGRLPTSEEMKNKDVSESMPQPDGLHHVIEDFTTSFDGSIAHVLPLRRFLEHHLNMDLRTYTAESCVALVESRKIADADQLPNSCRQYIQTAPTPLVFSEF